MNVAGRIQAQKYYRIGCCIGLVFLFGCNRPIERHKICSIGALSIDRTITNSLQFEEVSGRLIAKLLQCGKFEYYLAQFSEADSYQFMLNFVQEHEHTLPSRWDLRIGCPEAVDAYPTGAGKTDRFLNKLCEQVSKEVPVPTSLFEY